MSLKTSKTSLGKFLKRSRTETDVLRLTDAQKKKEAKLLSEVKLNAYIGFLKQQNAESVQGIFRISGRSDQVQQVRDLVDQNSSISIPNLDTEGAIHTVATALKGYLTSSEVSVVPSSLYDDFLGIIDTNEEMRINLAKQLLTQLPENHYNVLKLLLEYLLVISNNHEFNKMNLDNCGIIFGPVLFRPAVFDTSYILNVPKQSKTVEFLLANFHEVMGDSRIEEITTHISGENSVMKETPADILREDSDELEIDDEEFKKMKESEMPKFLQTTKKVESVLPHKWKQDKVLVATWCAGCQKIIAPKSRKKPVKLKVCEGCDIPVHIKCSEIVKTGCEHSKKQEETDSLVVGQESPNIPNVTTAADGTPISLHDILNEGKKVVVFFFPKSFTPLCTMENKCFRDNYDYFHYSNCEVIGISADTSECQKRFASQYKLPFHLISDQKGSLRKAFKVPQSMGGMLPGRVTFIIAPHSHKIMKVHNSSLAASDHVFVSLKIVASLIQMEAEVGSMALIDFSLIESLL